MLTTRYKGIVIFTNNLGWWCVGMRGYPDPSKQPCAPHYVNSLVDAIKLIDSYRNR